MIIKNISITNIRNHRFSEIEFADRLNIFSGLNGSGKTSILESIAVCGFSKSFLPVSDSMIITNGEEYYQLNLTARNELDLPYKISFGYTNGSRKKISSTYGDNLYPKDIIGDIPIIVLSPDFKSITFGSPQERRDFIDRTLSQSSKKYIEDALNLKKCLKQRNSILSSAKIDHYFNNELFDSWTDMFIAVSADIILRRLRFIGNFIPYFQKVYSELSDGIETVSLAYSPNSLSNEFLTHSISKNDIVDELKKVSLKLKKDEKNRGLTLFGPQKDELKIMINGGSAKEYASQGQHKTLLISMKFAEFYYLKDIKNETPIILLDDIFSELDSNRCKAVLDLILRENAQTFITTTESDVISKFLSHTSDLRIFTLESGKVVSIQ